MKWLDTSIFINTLVLSGGQSLCHHLFDFLNTSPRLLGIIHRAHRHRDAFQTLLILESQWVKNVQ